MPQDAVADNTSLEVHLQEVAIEHNLLTCSAADVILFEVIGLDYTLFLVHEHERIVALLSSSTQQITVDVNKENRPDAESTRVTFPGDL
uniref:Uncharacterized protein n=1 Tax=Trichobilharzia regenti TaxID=157069 RepID=A0AA85IVK9_TRIRE|nr:unnamed protein product [Trichobilharzia regenti]